MGGHHTWPRIENEDITGSLHSFSAILKARRLAVSSEEHSDHVSLVVAPRAGRCRLAAQGTLRDAGDLKRSDLRNVELGVERAAAEALNLDRNQSLVQEFPPEFKSSFEGMSGA